jgi:hypothetical protein
MSPLIAIEHIKWEDPPGWADEFDLNDLVFNPVVEPNRFAPQKKQSYDLAKLANTLA